MKANRNLHWVHSRNVRRAPAKMPDVWAFWGKFWDESEGEWRFRHQWVNENVQVSAGEVEGKEILIFHTILGEIWVADPKHNRKWIILSEQEVGYAAPRFDPIIDGVTNVEFA